MPKIIATKDHWIKLGYKLFSEQGISGIVVEAMAKKLNVNKSSFYWHFKTKEEFVNAIINFWITTETEQIIAQTEAVKSASGKFERFLEITFKSEPYLEFIFFLKRYAKKNKKIQKIIDDIDFKRLSYASNLFQEVGYSKAEATVRASIFYKYLIGYHEMIRNKKQPSNFLIEVKQELKYFLNI